MATMFPKQKSEPQAGMYLWKEQGKALGIVTGVVETGNPDLLLACSQGSLQQPRALPLNSGHASLVGGVMGSLTPF